MVKVNLVQLGDTLSVSKVHIFTQTASVPDIFGAQPIIAPHEMVAGDLRLHMSSIQWCC